MTIPPTCTRNEIMKRLGIKSRTAFHHLRRRYPHAFIVVHQGSKPGDPTLYDKAAADSFIDWRNFGKAYKGKTQ